MHAFSFRRGEVFSCLVFAIALAAFPLPTHATTFEPVYAAGEEIGSGPTIETLRLIEPSPTRSQTINFELTFSIDVLGVDVEDFVLVQQGNLNDASIIGVSGADDTYYVTVDTGTGHGLIRVDVLYNDTIYDLFGGALEGNEADEGVYSGGDTATIDRLGPDVVSILHPDPDTPLQSDTTDLTARFSEEVESVQLADFVPVVLSGSLTGVTIQQLQSAAGVYHVTLGLGTGVGTFRVDFSDRGTVSDTSGNPLGGPGAGNGDFTNSQILTVNRPLPEPAFSGTPLVGIAPLEVSFADETPSGTTPMLSRLWNFGALGTAATANPTVTYAQPGLYTVALTVSNAFGAATATELGYVRVLPDIGGEGEVQATYEMALIFFFVSDTDENRLISLEELQVWVPTFTQSLLDAADANGDNRLNVAELLEQTGGGIIMSGDTNADSFLSLAELLRLMQLHNASAYTCAENAGATEDGFEPGPGGPGSPACLLHSSDADRDQILTLSELLRAIQIFNLGGYTYCAPQDPVDMFCAGL